MLTSFVEMANPNKFRPTFKINGVSIRCPRYVNKEHFFELAEKIETAFSTGDTSMIEHFRHISKTQRHLFIGAVMKAKGLT